MSIRTNAEQSLQMKKLKEWFAMREWTKVRSTVVPDATVYENTVEHNRSLDLTRVRLHLSFTTDSAVSANDVITIARTGLSPSCKVALAVANTGSANTAYRFDARVREDGQIRIRSESAIASGKTIELSITGTF